MARYSLKNFHEISGLGPPVMFDHFDIIAPFYDRVIHKLDLNRLIDLLKLPAKGRLLDAGGGTGRVSSRLRSLIDDVVVCDLSFSMLKQARNKGRLLTVQTHVEHLPFPGESFERIIVVDALHHFCNQQESIQELLRVLKTGGRLVIEEPNIDNFMIKLLALTEKLLFMRSRFCSYYEIVHMIRDQGCTARLENDGRFFFWVVVEKTGSGERVW
jgi:demethylmenaquinone methyltransferase/2-methoxy-6-polyprenyl-1,4-benzoquinol methylase